MPIPVFRNLIFGSKKTFLTGFLRIFFFLRFPEEFFKLTWFWRGLRNSGFFPILQEFFDRIPAGSNTCIYSGFRRIPEDSCSREVICSRQTLPQLALPPASPREILKEEHRTQKKVQHTDKETDLHSEHILFSAIPCLITIKSKL